MPLSPDFKSVAEMPESERSLIRTYVARSLAGAPVSSALLLSHSDRQSLRCRGFPLQFKLARLARLRDLASDAEVRDALGKKLACMTSPAPQLEACRVPGWGSLESIHARHEAVIVGVLTRAGRFTRRDAGVQLEEPQPTPDSHGAPYPLPQSPGALHPLPESPGTPHPLPESPGALHPLPESPGTPHPLPQSPGAHHPLPESPGTPRHTSDHRDTGGQCASVQASLMQARVDATPGDGPGEEQVTAEVTPPPAGTAASPTKPRQARRRRKRGDKDTFLGNDERVIIEPAEGEVQDELVDVAARRNNKVHRSACMRVQAVKPTGRIGEALMSFGDMQGLQHGRWVTSGAIEVAMSWAAQAMQRRTGREVRVIGGSDFKKWRKYTEWPDESLSKHAMPPSMKNVRLEEADFALIGYIVGEHWSMLVLCHPGAQMTCERWVCDSASPGPCSCTSTFCYICR